MQTRTNQVILLFTVLALFACSSPSDDQAINPMEPIVTDSSKGPDTLYTRIQFEPSMQGEILQEKYKSGQEEIVKLDTFIQPTLAGIVRVSLQDNIEFHTNYLGLMPDEDGIHHYHVFTRFIKSGTNTTSPQGTSRLCFIHENKDSAISYDMEMPEHFPTSLSGKHLIYTFQDTCYGFSIEGGLPPALCLPKLGCRP